MLKPGTFIGDRYEVIDLVGSGGMAYVYKAKCHRLNRYVAIKILKPEYSSDKSFVDKFRNEAQSAAGLSHPNIVGVYDVGDDGELHYIVMELVEGITLKHFIDRKGKLEIKEAIGIGIQIAKGMEAAHDNNIIHRDIKPQNIIISKEGKVKVADFGIAKAINSNTITSNSMGSVHYLSPEQARGGYSDEKSDIYSLGVTLYEMLSGQVPFAGDNTVSVAMLHIQAEPTSLRELDPSIPISVDRIVAKCMQKRPDRRYHSASDLIVDLKKSIADPDGDFVEIPSFMASDSPTINLSDDINRIKYGDYNNNGYNNFQEDESETMDDMYDEEDDLDTVDSKLDKIYLAGYIIAAVLLFALVVFLVVKFVLPQSGSGSPDDGLIPTITVAPTPVEEEVTPTPGESLTTYKFPSVLNLTEEDAKAAIKAHDPDALVIVQEEYSNDYDEGRVMLQYPGEGADTVYRSEAIITISLGAESFEIPYVYAHTVENAEKKLREYGLAPTIEYVESDEIAEGHVVYTDPPAESRVISGDKVTVYVSSGSEQVAVPLLIGFTEAQARQMLEAQGLEIGEITRESSETTPEGSITYQSTSEGQMLDRGAKVNITVSSGPAEDLPGDEEETGGGEGTPAVEEYIGKVVIDVNPFNYLGGTEANFIFEMVQDEWRSALFEEPIKLKVTDFPYTISNIESDSGSPGTVIMYVEGIPFQLPGETGTHVFIAEFRPVEE